MIQYYFEKVKREQKKNRRMYSYRGFGEGYYPEVENGYLERVNA